MTRIAYLVAAPESAGNRLTVHTLTTAGISGNAAHTQPWDNADLTLSLAAAPDRLTFHRSIPHSGNWDAAANAAQELQAAGYTVIVLTPQRPQDVIERSQVARGLAADLPTARLRVQQALKKLAELTARPGIEPLPIITAELNNPHYLRWLADILDLPRMPQATYRNEDTKHRDPLPGQLAFSFNWTAYHADNWRRWFAPYQTQPFLEILTIGAAEGRSECWLFENFGNNPTTAITTIEPGLCPEWHNRLKQNHAAHPNRANWRLIEQPSQRALPALAEERRRFHILIVDGDHEEHAAYGDIIGGWPLLNPGGTMVLDDYRYRGTNTGEGVSNALRWALPSISPIAEIEVTAHETKGQARLTKPR